MARLKSGPTPAMAAHDLDHVARLFERLGLGRFARKLRPPVLWAVYVGINGFISIGLLSLLTLFTRVPFIFPSLGPTAYELFFRPRSQVSTPHNTLIGHLIGLCCGYAVFRLLNAAPGTSIESPMFDWRTVVAAALAVGFTAALMILLHASHPPAGATTLIVGLGIVTKPAYLGVIELAVLLLVLQAVCINRLAGLPYPFWRSRS